MNSTLHRISLSCLVILLAVCLCLSAISIGGALVLLAPQGTPEPTWTNIAPIKDISPAPASTPTPDETGISPGVTPQAESPPPETVQQMERIQEQVIRLRKLQPTGTVTRTLLTPAELRQHVINNFLDDYTPEDAQEDALVLAVFGLLEPNFDLRSFYIELYSEQIAGFYDHEDKQMYLVQGESFSGPERMTYAHEYVHVLQETELQRRHLQAGYRALCGHPGSVGGGRLDDRDAVVPHLRFRPGAPGDH
jgi:hypothetical protein